MMNGNVCCPRCSSPDVRVERCRKPFSDNLICEACGYVGPVRNPNQSGTYRIAEPQHNHHCLLTFHGFNWWITGCRKNRIDVARDMPGLRNTFMMHTIDTSAVDWEAYAVACAAWDASWGLPDVPDLPRGAKLKDTPRPGQARPGIARGGIRPLK